MAERIVSPGVFTRENDLSFIEQGVVQIGAAIVGPFKQGPAFVPTIIRTQSEFNEKFGIPDGTYYTDYAVQNYLREAGSVTVVRVMNLDGYTQDAAFALIGSGSTGEKILATLHSTATGDEETGFPTAVVTASLTDLGVFKIDETGLSDVTASLKPSSKFDVRDVFGTSAFGNKIAYAYTYFENVAENFTYSGTTPVKGLVMGNQVFDYEPTVASTPWVKSQLISGERYNLFRFHTLSHGNIENKRFKISISNVKAAGEDGSTDYSTFTVTVRRFDDTDKRKVVLETFNNVNLDPDSPNYIARVIGDMNRTIGSDGKLSETGDWMNNSMYVRVEVASAGSYPVTAAPFGHAPYVNTVYVGTGAETLIPAVAYTTTSNANTTSSPIYFSGFDFETTGVKLDNYNYLKPIPNNATTGSNVDFGFDSQLSYQMTGSNAADMVKRQFTVAFQGGFDGVSPTVSINLGANISAANSQGFDLSNSSAGGSVAYQRAINALSNTDEYDINLIATPGVIRRLHTSVTTAVIDMVEARQDCFYLADFSAINDTVAQVTTQANAVDTNYAATYYPWVKTLDTNTNKMVSVPPSVLLPAVYAANDAIAAEWYAPAGLNRGGILGAVGVVNRLTHVDRDTLYENKVNPIATFPGQGIVAFGQKTLQDKASALDRINVRRLLITVKKFIASTSRFLVFEQNTSTTRNRFINTVQPYLESIQQRQGLYAFKVVMDDSNNTPSVIDRNLLVGQIYLQPAKTAEFIVIDFNILPTGATFSA